MTLMLKLLVNFLFGDEAAYKDKYSDEAEANYAIESVNPYDDEGDNNENDEDYEFSSFDKYI